MPLYSPHTTLHLGLIRFCPLCMLTPCLTCHSALRYATAPLHAADLVLLPSHHLFFGCTRLAVLRPLLFAATLRTCVYNTCYTAGFTPLNLPPACVSCLPCCSSPFIPCLVWCLPQELTFAQLPSSSGSSQDMPLQLLSPCLLFLPSSFPFPNSTHPYLVLPSPLGFFSVFAVLSFFPSLEWVWTLWSSTCLPALPFPSCPCVPTPTTTCPSPHLYFPCPLPATPTTHLPCLTFLPCLPYLPYYLCLGLPRACYLRAFTTTPSPALTSLGCYTLPY